MSFAGVLACGGPETNPVNPEGARLLISATPRVIIGDGGVETGNLTEISVLATTDRDAAGTGVVALTTTAGKFVNNGTGSTSIQLAEGRGSVFFTCNVYDDARCSGVVTINGTWEGLEASTGVTVVGAGELSGASGGNLP